MASNTSTLLTPAGLLDLGLGKTEIITDYYNTEVAKALNEQAARQRVFGSTTRPAANAQFAANIAANTPKAQAVSDEASTWFRNLTASNAAYKPFEDTIKPIADYGFARLGDIAQYIPSLTRKANNQNALNLGLAPGARSSAVDRAQYSNTGAVFEKMLPSILNWATQNATLSANERSNAQLAGLSGIEGLKNEVDAIAYRGLMPLNIEAAGYAQDAENFARTAAASQANVAGYREEDNLVRRTAQAEYNDIERLKEAGDKAMSMYSSMYGGGGGGGGAGMYGGSGGTAMPSSTPSAGTSLQWRGGYQMPGGSDPYGGWRSGPVSGP